MANILPVQLRSSTTQRGATPDVEEMPLNPGSRLGPYGILAAIGAGGGGASPRDYARDLEPASILVTPQGVKLLGFG